MSKKLLAVIVIAVLFGGAVGAYLFSNNQEETITTNSASGPDSPETQSGTVTEKKAPHYESNTPASNSVLASAPPVVVIDFNFDLASGSTVDITKDGKSYATGETVIDENKLVLRRTMDPAAPDGLYTVSYKACWPDGSCHDGAFEFTIDSSVKSSYIDMTNKDDVEVSLSQIKFQPMDIRVSKGATVTWTNNEDVLHYVNTDSHPAHTHEVEFNSKALNKGDKYSYVFDTVGAYPYHCSAHATNMAGNIVVED